MSEEQVELKAIADMDKGDCIEELDDLGVVENEHGVKISKRNLNLEELQECVKQAREEDKADAEGDKPKPEEPKLAGDDIIERESHLMELAKAPKTKRREAKEEPRKKGKSAKKGEQSFQNLIDHLRKSGTGRGKCDQLEKILNQVGDIAAAEAVALFEEFGMPPGTITKAQAFLEEA